jgi:hypothetical protein
VTVHYATRDDSARAGADYVAKQADLTFAPGQTTRSVTVQVKHNPHFADDFRSFELVLSHPSGADLGFSSIGLAFIVKSVDSATKSIGVAVDDPVVDEPQHGKVPVLFRVTLSRKSAKQTTVQYVTRDAAGANAAKAGSDYVAKHGVLTFAPGQTTRRIGVVVKHNPDFNVKKRFFFLDLSPPSGGAGLAKPRGVGTIVRP